MKRFAFAIALLVVWSHVGRAEDGPKVSVEDEAQWKKVLKLLAGAESIELYSLNPERQAKDKDGAKLFHGWTVLGQTTLKGDDVKKVSTIVASIKPDYGAKCFDPRHAFQIKGKEGTVDILLCYECKWAYIFFGTEEKRALAWTIKDGEGDLDALLKAAKVPLAEKSKK